MQADNRVSKPQSLNVMMSSATIARVRIVAIGDGTQPRSVSAVVETLLEYAFGRLTDAQLEKLLTSTGAKRRRKRVEAST